MPGFKQMVVKVKRQDTDMGRTSTDGGSIRSPPLPNTAQGSERNAASVFSTTPAAVESDVRTPLNLPFYDTSPMPPSELITHLANTFFTHLGCNYPFLQRERFMRDLEEKQVDAILVDAVCALSARFSTHTLLTQNGGDDSTPAEYGHAFAQRAKLTLIDAFPCPSVAAAQAALLLAYNEFGEQRDSGLWMYLGISIRLAQDLGLHKLEGLQYVGKDGPTPKVVKHQARGSSAKPIAVKPSPSDDTPADSHTEDKEKQSEDEVSAMNETKAVEQERIDTFWAIFFLDRVVSSGTGRRGTLRDKDIEISFPSMSENIKNSDWPAPFPALIRIVHLYGRVADLLNSIKEPSDVTTETPKRLAAMESQVTNFYQGLSSRLHFDAVNFQYYMKAGEGTNFVLLHFWFHMLIVLLHRPTLFKTFDARILQLFPNSQQLSMSSAKTIADILSYSQLMDAKASLGNPFTTQPIYVAACAFLKETAEQTATSNAQSRATSPNRSKDNSKDNTSDSAPSTNGTPSDASKKASIPVVAGPDSPKVKPATSNTVEHRLQLAKHTLLATAASQHYQLCYKALQSLETYWAGTKYILTILDQKFEGVEDPLLYTAEEGESSMEQPRPQPSFTSPGWRRKLSWGPANAQASLASAFWPPKGFGAVPGSPGGVDPSKGKHSHPTQRGVADETNLECIAIGWTLTGTMNSPSTNLAWHYAGGNSQNSNLDPKLGGGDAPELKSGADRAWDAQNTNHPRADSTSSRRLSQYEKIGRSASHQFNGSSSAIENDSKMGLNPAFQPQGNAIPPTDVMAASYLQPSLHHSNSVGGVGGSMQPPYTLPTTFMNDGGHTGQVPMHFLPGDMMIESQDVDMSMLGLDMMPWFDSFPTHDPMGNGYDFNHGNPATGGAEGPGGGT
jgi:hypothetical protein